VIDVDVNLRMGTFDGCFRFKSDQKRVVLFGSSGSGKSTLLKLIAGFHHPDSGSIQINGCDFYSRSKNYFLPVQQRHIGYLPQEYVLFPHLSVRENALYGVRVRNQPVNHDHFNALVERLDIGSCLDAKPANLSGGQQQRVALARCLMLQPQLLLLDEPFSALDTSTRNNLREMVIELSRDFNLPIIFVTHDIEEASLVGEEMILIEQGRVLEIGTNRQIFQRPRLTASARLLDFCNIWPAQKHGNRVVLESGADLQIMDNDAKSLTHVAIRPEQIMIVRPDKPFLKHKSTNSFAVRIQRIRHHVRYMKLDLVHPLFSPLVMHLPEHVYQVMQLREDQQINVILKQEALVALTNATSSQQKEPA